MGRKYRHTEYWQAKKDASEPEEFFRLSRDFYIRSSFDWRDIHNDGKYWFPHQAVAVWLNILLFLIAVDTGVAVAKGLVKIADPDVRKRIKEEMMRDLRIVRRPFYYIKEKERRRALAAERRKVRLRSTFAPEPKPEEILAAWNARKESREAMLRLGCLLEDLACHVDSGLRFDATGAVCGRNGGIRGWLLENLPVLLPKYKTLMRYKALAKHMKQISGSRDPEPAGKMLEEPRRTAIAPILDAEPPAFSRMFAEAERLLSPDMVFRTAARSVKKRRPPA